MGHHSWITLGMMTHGDTDQGETKYKKRVKALFFCVLRQPEIGEYFCCKIKDYGKKKLRTGLYKMGIDTQCHAGAGGDT